MHRCPSWGWPFQFHHRLVSCCFFYARLDAADQILTWAVAAPSTLMPHRSLSVKTNPVTEVCASRQCRGHAHVDQEGLPVNWPMCLLFLLGWGQLFLSGDRCLSTLKTSTHHPFPNFSVLTHTEERGRDRLSALRRQEKDTISVRTVNPPLLAQSSVLVFQPWRTLGRIHGQGWV